MCIFRIQRYKIKEKRPVFAIGAFFIADCLYDSVPIGDCGVSRAPLEFDYFALAACIMAFYGVVKNKYITGDHDPVSILGIPFVGEGTIY